jgi:hypothetical protein
MKMRVFRVVKHQLDLGFGDAPHEVTGRSMLNFAEFLRRAGL